MVRIIQVPDEFVPGIVSDRLLAVMTVALGATYLVAVVIGVVDIASSGDRRHGASPGSCWRCWPRCWACPTWCS